MPIGDLLASIGSGKATPDSRPIKRKPSNDLPNDSKTPKVTHPARSSEKPTARPYTGSAARPSNGTSMSRPTQAPAALPAKAAPKKGSFAEILARAQRAQASMGQVGRIQHQKTEGGAIKRSREEAATTGDTRRKAKPNGSKYTGTAKPGQQRNGSGMKKATTSTGPRRKAAAEQEAVKKVKKAASATTGYTGTSRPKTDIPSRSKKEQPRGGALLNGPLHSSSRRRGYEDDYDEELDDFIDYDDEEEDGGGGGRPRYDYASDGSSDMEAGMDELDVEEQRASHIARREDIEEERIERNLKMAKEERKRKALEEYRAQRKR